MDVEAATNELIEWMRGAPPLPTLLLLFWASLLEYVVPPIPGDTLVIAGGVFAAQGVLPVVPTFLATTLGSIAGAVSEWGIGRLVRHSPRIQRWSARVVAPEKMAAFEASYRRRGRWFLLANRFLVGVRTTFLFLAGYSGVPLKDVLIYGSISAVAWNLLLVSAGYLLGAQLEAVFAFVRSYTTVAWIALAVVVLLVVGRVLWKRRRKG